MNGDYTAVDLVKELQRVREKIEEANASFKSARATAVDDLNAAVTRLVQSDGDSRASRIAVDVWNTFEKLDGIVDERKRAAEHVKGYIAAHFRGLTGGAASSLTHGVQIGAPLGYRGVEELADSLEKASSYFGVPEDAAAANAARGLEEQTRDARREARKHDTDSLIDIGFVVLKVVSAYTGCVPAAILVAGGQYVWESYKALRWHTDDRVTRRALKKPFVQLALDLFQVALASPPLPTVFVAAAKWAWDSLQAARGEPDTRAKLRAMRLPSARFALTLFGILPKFLPDDVADLVSAFVPFALAAEADKYADEIVDLGLIWGSHARFRKHNQD